MINGTPVEGVAVNPLEHFIIKNYLIYRAVEINGNSVEQVLVPKPHRLTVLKLAHSHFIWSTFGGRKSLAKNHATILLIRNTPRGFRLLCILPRMPESQS